MEYNIINDPVIVKNSHIVKMAEHFTLLAPEGALDLKVDIIADFENIPLAYHEVFLNILTAKYLNKVSFGDNPFSLCKPLVKRKWWQFWKPKTQTIKISEPEIITKQ